MKEVFNGNDGVAVIKIARAKNNFQSSPAFYAVPPPTACGASVIIS